MKFLYRRVATLQLQDYFGGAGFFFVNGVSCALQAAIIEAGVLLPMTRVRCWHLTDIDSDAEHVRLVA